MHILQRIIALLCMLIVYPVLKQETDLSIPSVGFLSGAMGAILTGPIEAVKICHFRDECWWNFDTKYVMSIVPAIVLRAGIADCVFFTMFECVEKNVADVAVCAVVSTIATSPISYVVQVALLNTTWKSTWEHFYKTDRRYLLCNRMWVLMESVCRVTIAYSMTHALSKLSRLSSK